MSRPFIVGLTGGIGSGKSVVSEMFSGLGVPVLDADIIARDLVGPGQPALEKIVQVFGNGIVDDSGKLRRDRLREIVFADETSRIKLESILHPLVYQKIESDLNTIQSPYCILSIPLLLETGAENRVNSILVVDSPVSLQIQRVCSRDGVPRKQVESIIKMQAPRGKRLEMADDVIINDGDLSQLAVKVKQLHLKYTQIANNQVNVK